MENNSNPNNLPPLGNMGERIKFKRLAAHLTQDELGKKNRCY